MKYFAYISTTRNLGTTKKTVELTLELTVTLSFYKAGLYLISEKLGTNKLDQLVRVFDIMPEGLSLTHVSHVAGDN